MANTELIGKTVKINGFFYFSLMLLLANFRAA